MKKFNTLLLFVLWCLRAIVLPAVPVPAEHIAVILILDNSGSMQTSDPGDLRFTGVRLFASLLDLQDALGLILFSTQAEGLTDGIETFVSQADKKNVLEGIQFQDPDGYTDVQAALARAKGLLESNNLQDKKIVIVFLTDGKPEIQSPYPEYERETLDLARTLNIPVMAIALTSAAQTPFLDQLAAATHGKVFPAEDASDLMNAYLQVLGEIKDRTVIGGEQIQTVSSLEIDHALAPYINSVTFVVGKPEVTSVHLLGPDDREITANNPNVNFADSSDPHFELITLENPVGGKYSFHIQGGGASQVWAILRSRLRVEVVEAGRIHPLGDELAIIVNLLEETTAGNFIKIIGEANFTARITRPDGSQVSLDRFYDDGTHGDAVANDGDYTRVYPNTDVEGVYQISIEGWKAAIPVQTERQVTILRFPEIMVDAPVGTVQVRGERIELRVHWEGGDPQWFDQGEVTARIVSPAGRVEEIALQGNGVVAGEFLPAEDGAYQVLFGTRDVKYRGVDYQTGLEHSFNVSIVPFVKVNLTETNIPSACFSTPDEIALSLAVTSSDAETLRLSVPDGWRILPETVRVKQGEQNIAIRLVANAGMRQGLQRVELLIEGGSRLEVLPEAVMGVELQFPDMWTRCRMPIRLGAAILILMLVGTTAIQRAHKAALPLPVSGTLRHWQSGEGSIQAVEVDLTALRKVSILVGSGATCDVILPHAELAPQHARLIAQKSPAGPEIYLEPIGEVRKGYGRQPARFALQHGETFQMGTHEFQYLSDHGE
jgi:hypothetical protein